MKGNGAVVVILVFNTSLFLMLLMHSIAGQEWMSLALSSNLASHLKKDQCDKFNDLAVLQRRFCKDNIELMPSVIKGSVLALKECQYQFRWRRWNCSTINKWKKPRNSPFGLALKSGTREAAFVNSIFSAGIANAITKECSMGKITKCHCDLNLRGFSRSGFQWSGCSDDVMFGVDFSKEFVDSYDKWTTSWSFDRILMNLHNNEAGRKAIENNLAIRCSCHGVSGTCTMMMCSRVIPFFREIGRKLKEKFDSASKVKMKRIGARSALLPEENWLKPLTNQDLAYLKESPSYCYENENDGSLGTTNRYCNKESKGIDGCSLLCCDRGFKSSTEVVKNRCNCNFKWCCKVTCKTCSMKQKVHRCL